MIKNLVVLAILIFAGFFVINNFSPNSQIVEQTTNKALMPMRYANLLAKEPEAKIKIPVRTVRKKQIADTWGAPRSGEREHQGQDIFAKRGTPIYSATEGYVWRVDENNLGGNTVSVVGAGGRVYYYAHLEGYAPDLKTGDYVTPETVLGYVGTTGNAKGTPPHLHFGVYSTSGAINPISLFE